MSKKTNDQKAGTREQQHKLSEMNYPPEEDITNPQTGFRKVEADVEDLANSKRLSSAAADAETDKIHAEEGNDLDIPGTELDDADEIIGEEDEENNYYSLGGERHEDLEEDRS